MTPPCFAWPVAALLGAFAVTDAQTLTGAWEGVAGGQRVFVLLNSGASGWSGRFFAPSFRRDTFQIAGIVVRGVSVVLQLPQEGMSAALRGTISGDHQRFGGLVIVGPDTAGAFRLARAGTPAAATLLAQLLRSPAERRFHDDPDSARLITSDIPLFWDVLDRAPADSLDDWLEREYLMRGSPGLRDFVPGRILSAADLALQVRRRRAHYDSVRAATLRIAEAEPGIRAAYRALKGLYPETVYPDVYFVIGRFNSGGTASGNGLLIGAEMYRDPGRLPAIVAHELIHFQQLPYRGPRTLLAQSFREGACDFVGEMISGAQINNAAHRYGREHERELWKEFQARMRDSTYAGWLYGDPPGERPADLGYFMGYRITQAYYEKSADKRSALRDIIRGTDVESILTKSGYDP